MAKKIRITHMPKDEDQIFFNISYKGFPFLHTHDHFFEIMFIVEGEIQHTVLDKTTNLGENTLCFITPDLIHSINIQPNSHYINMGINEKYFNNIISFVAPTIQNLIKESLFTSFIVPNPNRIKNLINQHLISPDKNIKNIYTRMLLIEMLSQLLNYQVSNAVDITILKNPVFQLIKLMNNNENYDKPLNKLIEQTHYSVSRINKLFKRETGKSPGQYFLEKKMQYAKTLLSDTSLTIIEISYKVGYSSYAHFSVKFREMFGIPPKEYLKQHRHDMYSTITTKIID